MPNDLILYKDLSTEDIENYTEYCRDLLTKIEIKANEMYKNGSDIECIIRMIHKELGNGKEK